MASTFLQQALKDSCLIYIFWIKELQLIKKSGSNFGEILGRGFISWCYKASLVFETASFIAWSKPTKVRFSAFSSLECYVASCLAFVISCCKHIAVRIRETKNWYANHIEASKTLNKCKRQRKNYTLNTISTMMLCQCISCTSSYIT